MRHMLAVAAGRDWGVVAIVLKALMVSGLWAAAGVSLAWPTPVRSAALDSVTGLTIPLLSYESVVPLADGCQVILPNTSDPKYYRTMYWSGGCRFGLAHGPGYWYDTGEYSTKKYYPMTYRYGHALPAPRFESSFPRGPGRDASEYISFSDPRHPGDSDKDILERNGEFAIMIIASQFIEKDLSRDFYMVRIFKHSCPEYDVAKSLSEPTIGVTLTSAQQKLLLPMCNAAVARLKAQGADDFDKVDYGYYYVVYKELDVSPREGYGYGAATSDISSDATLCPNLTTIVGCEAVWEPMRASLIARRNALSASWSKVMAADAGDLERRFAPLEAALRRKLAARAARGKSRQ